ncbi:MAG: calcium/sodium antiporter [Flammeovirgaceae bacterium]
MLDYLLFLVGFVCLVKGADLLVDGASSIAKQFNVSDFIVGLTIVSLGTSMPELVVNIMASLSGSSEIAIGNVIGSNIANILLILGISAMICPLPIQKNTVLSEIPFSLTATLLVGFLANAGLFNENGQEFSLSRFDGGILLAFFALFMAYIFNLSKESRLEEAAVPKAVVVPDDEIKTMPSSKAILWIAIGVGGLFLGGKWVVDGAMVFAKELGFSETFVGLTIVAVGTSLPELVTSAVAATKKKTDLAVGNVIGSNIFNLLWILGISASIHPMPFDVITNDDILILIGSSSLIIFFLATGRKNTIDRWEGAIFLILYIVYVVYLVMRG